VANIPYEAFFISFPRIIDGAGNYVTRCGEVVEVTDTSGYHWKRGVYSNGLPEYNI
jgi:hypothetical protein